jgi:hypothetical protein
MNGLMLAEYRADQAVIVEVLAAVEEVVKPLYMCLHNCMQQKEFDERK